MSTGKCFSKRLLNLIPIDLAPAMFLLVQFSQNVSKNWKSTKSIYNLVVSSAIAYPHEVLRSRQQDSRS
jgi:hypothetical protein